VATRAVRQISVMRIRVMIPPIRRVESYLGRQPFASTRPSDFDSALSRNLDAKWLLP
jgi:hypothetical protein